jgi:5-methylcytosine-specific restriction endonuclease McrA
MLVPVYRKNDNIVFQPIFIKETKDKPRKTDYNELKSALYGQQGGECYYCGIRLHIKAFQIEHKTPKTRQGTNDIYNLCLACPTCNALKYILTEEEFKSKYGVYLKLIRSAIRLARLLGCNV